MVEQNSNTLDSIDSGEILARLLGNPNKVDLASTPLQASPTLLPDHLIDVTDYRAELESVQERFADSAEPFDSSDAAKQLLDQVFSLADTNASTAPVVNPAGGKTQAIGASASGTPANGTPVGGTQAFHPSPSKLDSNYTNHSPSSEQFRRRIEELSTRLSISPQSLSRVPPHKDLLTGVAIKDNAFESKELSGVRPFDVSSVRTDFPALHQSINGHPLVWFDNAATTQKPKAVIDSLVNFYSQNYSNIHRAAHTLAARSTDAYEDAREQVRSFVNASSTKDIVFVRGTTEGMNFIANVAKSFLHERDEIVLTELEHHANIVPWQLIAQETGARIRVVPINDKGEIIFDEYRRILGHRTRIVSITHASNTLGTILPIHEMTQLAKKHNACVVIDGAQSIAHLPVDVRSIGCDFFVFSGHKVFAPTGIGAVYVAPHLHEKLPPWQGGGNMIVSVRFDDTTYAPAPAKFEAGTPSIGDAVGLAAAIRYLRQFNMGELEAHEHSLLHVASEGLRKIRGVTTYGDAVDKVGLVSFTLAGYETNDVGKELDRHGIAVRTGHHCAQPSLRHFGLESTIRPSFALYNTIKEVERMIDVVAKLAK